MKISANFAFLKQEFPHAAESASYAERHVHGDPRASCFHARYALECLVKRVYKVEKTLSPPKVTNLDAYLSEPAFRALVPEVVWQKAEYVRQAGNVAVHGNKTPPPELALNVVRGAGARPLLGGPHLSAERGGEPSREDLRRVPGPHTGIGRGAGQRRGTGRSEARPRRSRGRAQGGRRRVGGAT